MEGWSARSVLTRFWLKMIRCTVVYFVGLISSTAVLESLGRQDKCPEISKEFGLTAR